MGLQAQGSVLRLWRSRKYSEGLLLACGAWLVSDCNLHIIQVNFAGWEGQGLTQPWVKPLLHHHHRDVEQKRTGGQTNTVECRLERKHDLKKNNVTSSYLESHQKWLPALHFFLFYQAGSTLVCKWHLCDSCLRTGQVGRRTCWLTNPDTQTEGASFPHSLTWC